LAAGVDVVDLFSPLTLDGMRLRNRAVVAPMTRTSATAAGEATPQMLRYYEAFARGGWGLVETEATYIDEEQSQCRAGQPGLATARQRDAWRAVVDSVHAHGACVAVQLQHAGALAETRRDGVPSVAPSAVEPRSKQPLPMPRALTRGEIARIHEHFARAASLGVEAGFDAVELHGGNGYLIDQFLTPETNHRTDEYGGPTTHRVRFAVEAVQAVRAVVPRGYPVGVRVQQHKTADPGYTWAGGDVDVRTIVGALVAAGASFVHIGGQSAPARANGNGQLVCSLAKLSGTVVIVNGGLEAPERAGAILAAGDADLVSIARGALANPDWPHRVSSGLPLRRFDPAMIRPVATLDRAEAWRHEQADSVQPIR
jgi:2,4-dienoyl-CoA reductase-like NADH-dependent reductase (Old Yellow Enzyme family)